MLWVVREDQLVTGGWSSHDKCGMMWEREGGWGWWWWWEKL